MNTIVKLTAAIVCGSVSCGKKLSFIEKNTCLCNKCGSYHCTNHRLPETHLCKYDFMKDINKDKFILDNRCVAEKIIKL